MFSFETVQARLLAAGALPEALDACLAAFEWAGRVADWFAGLGSAHFATWMSVAAPTSEGMHAIGFAPSMPGTAAGLAGPGDLTGVAEAEAAAMVAALAAALQECLRVAAGVAGEPGDVAACVRAAAAAAEIGELFAAV
jgi:hypothetical protein